MKKRERKIDRMRKKGKERDGEREREWKKRERKIDRIKERERERGAEREKKR